MIESKKWTLALVLMAACFTAGTQAFANSSAGTQEIVSSSLSGGASVYIPSTAVDAAIPGVIDNPVAPVIPGLWVSIPTAKYMMSAVITGTTSLNVATLVLFGDPNGFGSYLQFLPGELQPEVVGPQQMLKSLQEFRLSLVPQAPPRAGALSF